MKIEKINDNQIRCTVTMADLHDRHLKISELITNSAKAKLLLQDMVQLPAPEHADLPSVRSCGHPQQSFGTGHQ